MQRIIKNNEVVDETWHLLPKDTPFDGISNCDDLIVPLALWREHGPALQARDGGLGVWLDSDEEAEEIGEVANQFEVIALNFPAFTDGRNYSNARLCAIAMASRVNCAPSATCYVTSCSTCTVAASMPSPCAPTRIRTKHWKASRTSP